MVRLETGAPLICPKWTYWLPDALHLITLCRSMDKLLSAVSSFEEEGAYPAASDSDEVRQIVEPDLSTPNEVVIGAPHIIPLGPSLEFMFDHLANEMLRLWLGNPLSEYGLKEYFPSEVFSKKGISFDADPGILDLPYLDNWKLEVSRGGSRISTRSFGTSHPRQA